MANCFTYKLERGDLLVAVRVKVLLRIVDGHAAVDTVEQCRILHDGHTFVCAVGVLEKQDGRPVVGKVLETLKAFPPTIWWTCDNGGWPGSTRGSRRWIERVEHPKRSAACEGPTRAKVIESHFVIFRDILQQHYSESLR